MAPPLDAAHAMGGDARPEDDGALGHAYRAETARLIRARLELSVALFLLFMGIVVLVESRMPGHASVVVAFVVEAVIAGGAVLLARRPTYALATQPIALVAMAGIALTMLVFSASVRSPWDAVALGQVCLMACLAIVLPWGFRAQVTLAALSCGGFLLATPFLEQSSPGIYPLIALVTGATTSTLAAFFLDRYRFEAFARTAELSRAYALQQEEAEISAALLHVVQTLSQLVGRADVLAQVNRLVVDALGCDWSNTFVYDPERDRFRFVQNFGSRPEIRTELESMDFPPDSMPIFAELEKGRLIELDDAATQSLVPPELLARWEIASMLCAPIHRHERLIGILGCGYAERRGPFSRKQRQLMQGIGHAVAVGVDNERLIRDLRAANRLKSDFVATMSHELRTPLNVILGYAEMLAEVAEQSPHEAELFAARIQRSATELLELVNATLDLGRMESGRDDLHVEPVEIAGLLGEIEREVEGLAGARALSVSWRNALGRATVATDRVKLKTIVKNLVGNAIKYTPSGEVVVSAEAEDDVLVVGVRDTGVGIAAEHLQTIFEMFRQLDSSTTRTVGGVGLGLYIVRQLVERLGGTIEVESTVGVGSTFTVRLPAGNDEGRTTSRPAERRLSS